MQKLYSHASGRSYRWNQIRNALGKTQVDPEVAMDWFGGVIHGWSILCWWGFNLVGDGGVARGDCRGIPATSSRLQL